MGSYRVHVLYAKMMRRCELAEQLQKKVEGQISKRVVRE